MLIRTFPTCPNQSKVYFSWILQEIKQDWSASRWSILTVKLRTGEEWHWVKIGEMHLFLNPLHQIYNTAQQSLGYGHPRREMLKLYLNITICITLAANLLHAIRLRILILIEIYITAYWSGEGSWEPFVVYTA